MSVACTRPTSPKADAHRTVHPFRATAHTRRPAARLTPPPPGATLPAQLNDDRTTGYRVRKRA